MDRKGILLCRLQDVLVCEIDVVVLKEMKMLGEEERLIVVLKEIFVLVAYLIMNSSILIGG